MFGFCITHILKTGCAKIKKKIRRQKVNIHVIGGRMNSEGFRLWYVTLRNTVCLDFVHCLILKNLELVLFALTCKILLQSGGSEQRAELNLSP